MTGRWRAVALVLVLIGSSACGDDGPRAVNRVARDVESWSVGQEDWTDSFVLEEWSSEAFTATDMRFLPDGRALVITKGGWGGPADAEVRLLEADGSASRTILTLPVCTDAERGLLGLELHPEFETNPLVYLFYTRQMSECAKTTELFDDIEQPVWNRLSVFRFDEAGIDPASEQVLLDELPGHATAHNAGGLAFMPDGSLLVSVGEAGYRRSRDPDVVMGKLLRIDPVSAEGLPDNPAFDPSNPASVQSRTYASGFRNAFRIGVDPTSGTVVAADVGTNDWEEVNLVVPGADYGFPDGEGPVDVEGGTSPALTYGHLDGCNSVIGGAWVPPRWVPGADERGFAFTDFGCGGVFVVYFDGDEAERVAVVAGKLDRSLASVVYGPDNALYLVGIGPGDFPIMRLAPDTIR